MRKKEYKIVATVGTASERSDKINRLANDGWVIKEVHKDFSWFLMERDAPPIPVA